MQTPPELSSEYPLARGQVERFARDGHICLRGVLSREEAAAWREAVREAALRHATEKRELKDRDEYGKAFLQIGNLWHKEPSVGPLTLSKRLAKIAGELMQVESVRLYHDQALFKEPGGAPTHWHQDQTYMPFDVPGLIGIWIPLVPVPQEVGSMTFVSGSHRLGWLGDLPWSREAEAAVQDVVRRHGLGYTSYGAMEPGDVTLHSAWTLHSAKGNPTTEVREVMNIFYLDGSARIVEPWSKKHAIGLEHAVGGRRVGDLPDSGQNPIVWTRDGRAS